MTHPAKKVRHETSSTATAHYYNTAGAVQSRFQLSSDISYLITTQPNSTIVAFDLPTDCTELEINNLFSSYGPVKNMQKVCGGKAALIEFTEMSSPTRLVHWAKINPFYVGSTQVRLEFSSQAINTPMNSKPLPLNSPVLGLNSSRILHLDITNADYPITVDVLKTICSPLATPIKIFIGKKNVDKSLEALIEFSNTDDARKVHENLHGADIYSGCCSLSVSFSKISKVHVTRNDTESWDFTGPNPSKECLLNHINGQKTLLGPVGSLRPFYPFSSVPSISSNPPIHIPYPPIRMPPTAPPFVNSQPPFLLQQNYHNYQGSNGRCIPPPSQNYHPPITPENHMSFGNNLSAQCRMPMTIPPNYLRPPPTPNYPVYPPFNPSSFRAPIKYSNLNNVSQIIPSSATIHHVTPDGIGIGHATSNLIMSSPNAHNTDLSCFKNEEGVVLMVSNLPPGVDCDHIFNLLCLYGNIARIKFLKSRPGCAMIQMGSKDSADLIYSYLNGAHVFGQTIQLYRSKQVELQENAGLGTLADGSPVMKNYLNDPNNRFRNSVVAAKCRILTPISTLHFFNAPLDFTPEDIRRVFAECGVKCPPRIVIFAAKLGQKTSLGLIEWDSLSDALNALALANHHLIRVSGFSHPFHLKLAFSPKPISQDRSGYSSFSFSAPEILLNDPIRSVLAPINNGKDNFQSQTIVTVASTTFQQTITEICNSNGETGSKDANNSYNSPSRNNSRSTSLNVDELEAEEEAYLENLANNETTTEVENVLSDHPDSGTSPHDSPIYKPEFIVSDECVKISSIPLEKVHQPYVMPRYLLVHESESIASEKDEDRAESPLDIINQPLTISGDLPVHESKVILAQACEEGSESQLGKLHQPPATPPSESDDCYE